LPPAASKTGRAADHGRGPALAILESTSIARGVVVVDAAMKRAEVTLLASRVVSGGLHLTIFAGDTEAVTEAFAAGTAAGGAILRDRLLLPYAHDQLWPLLGDPVHPAAWTGDPRAAAAIVETTTVCAAVAAADAACKAADITIRDMRLAIGISGKAFFTMSGDLHDLDAAADAARAAATDRLVTLEIIAAPAAELVSRLLFS
jgi:microcompartment protein CcmL/EutN